jgi:iron-sulfur cluster repair protein YtfE (RIC family)
MLVSLGQRRSADDVVDLLLECHGRIRAFLGHARRLAATPGAPVAEAQELAGRVRRYFVEAYPLHVADEDELVIPRLVDRGPDVDAALAAMHAEHRAHDEHVARLVALCAAIEAAPGDLAATAGALAEAVDALAAQVDPHLALEERVIFPALRALPQAERDEIRAGMKRRRGG